MRVLPIVIGLLCAAVPVAALAKAKPKIAVAPLKGDTGNKVAQAIVEAIAGKDFAVIGPKAVSREITKLGLGDELDTKDARKLARKLGAVALVDGTVTKAGKKRSLHLEVHRRGKPDAGFTVEFKSTGSEAFRRGVREEIVNKLDGADDDGPGTDDDDQAKPTLAKLSADDDARRTSKPADDDAAARRARKQADDDADSKRKLADDDAARRSQKRDEPEPDRKPRRDPGEPAARRKRVADTDEDQPAVRKRKTARREADEAGPQLLARLGVGASVAQRQLSYATRAGFTQIPPQVQTTAGSGRLDGEIYPFALANTTGALAGLGLAVAYDKTFGLAIKIPNQTVSAPINQSHYALGARYRIGVGDASTIAFGLDYARRSYIADRSGLMTLTLDAPDVDYTAIVPGVGARVPVTDTVAILGSADGMLMLDTGPIQATTSYGPATVYGLEALAGVDIALARQIGLRVAVEYSQINFSFNGKGALANNRDGDAATPDVNGATDRSIGVVATVGLVY